MPRLISNAFGVGEAAGTTAPEYPYAVYGTTNQHVGVPSAFVLRRVEGVGMDLTTSSQGSPSGRARARAAANL